MMSLHYVWPSHTAASSVSHKLATACSWLTHAAIVAERLVAIDPHYRGTTGWDLQIAINDAIAHVKAAVRVHDLSKFDPSWSSRAIHDSNTECTITALDTMAYNAGTHRAGHRALRRGTAWLLSQDLANAFENLTGAAESAARLVANEDADDTSFGAIGWDLETAIDDAMIDVRDAMRAGRLAKLGTYWEGKL